MTDTDPLAALVDIDGTLLDSNDAHARAWVDAFSRHGRPQPFERVRPLIGKGGDKLLAELLGISDEEPLGQALTADWRRTFDTRERPTLRPTPGARALLERLAREGWTTVIATSSDADEARSLLRQAGVEDLASLVTSSSDAARSKPDPDIVEAALRLGGARPERAVMIGDTPYDIEAARRAGVGTVALRCGGHWADADLAGALAIYDDPADLLAHWDASPLAGHPGGTTRA